jgi:transcriptional regulator with XRE-family HTH domain
MKPCTFCSGKGEAFAFSNRGEDSSTHTAGMMECPTCKGSGSITDAHYGLILSGKKMREERVAAGMTLSEAAARAGVTVTQLSAIENGRVPKIYSHDQQQPFLDGKGNPIPDISQEECLRLAREIYPIGHGDRKTVDHGKVFKHIGVGHPKDSADANAILKAYLESYGAR